MPKSSREVIEIIQTDGWYICRTKGSHYQFKHPIKTGTVTIPHPVKTLKKGTIKSIEKQAGVKILDF
ncbi:MAG: type II toxin-antitoxin system HicA family toxin [Bacillaceae bacterium]|nr:type II toxin-antitoxin system HicA family toxin [Bacillaceae bacterium]